MHEVSRLTVLRCGNQDEKALARLMANTIVGHRGRFTSGVATAKNHNERRPTSRLPSSVSTLTNAFRPKSIASVEKKLNEVLAIVLAALADLVPSIRPEASLDEIVLETYEKRGRPAEKWGFQWDTIGNPKNDGRGRVLQFHVTCVHYAHLKVKVPVHFSLYTRRDKISGEFDGTSLPPWKDVVDESMRKLSRLSVVPKMVYADAGFASADAINHLADWCRRIKAKRGVDVFFHVNARRSGAEEPDIHDLELSKTKRSRRKFFEPLSPRVYIENAADLVTECMKGQPSHWFRIVPSNDIACGVTDPDVKLVIVARPRREDDADSTNFYAAGPDKICFGVWTNKPITATSAYGFIQGYGRRNYIESLFAQYRRHFDISRAQDIRLRVLTFGLALVLMAGWALLSVRRGLDLKRFEHSDYPFSRFLDAVVDILRETLKSPD